MARIKIKHPTTGVEVELEEGSIIATKWRKEAEAKPAVKQEPAKEK